MVGDSLKICQTCKEHLSKDKFWKDYPRCKSCDKKAQTKYKEENPSKFRLAAHKKRLKHCYDLDYEEYIRLCEEQNHVCKLCGKDNNSYKLAVDHSHTTGKVRGLLCNTCNRAIGLFKDNPELIERAATYLKSVTH